AAQALVPHGVREVPEIVLERVGNPALAEADERGTVVAEYFLAHHLLQQRVELAKMAEYHVAAQVPGETGGVDDRGGQAAGARLSLKYQPIMVTQPLQLAGTGHTTLPC